jgi:iron(II)-dependent oxidoreductase
MPSRPTADLIPPGTLTAEEVRRHLDAARERLLVLTGDLCGERLLGPKLAIVNPPQWEIGHVAWFQEYWCLRMRAGGTLAPSRLDDADRLYDSTAIRTISADLPLPSPTATRSYLEAVLDGVCEALVRRADDQRLLYFAELAACHEDMHGRLSTPARPSATLRRLAKPASPAGRP